VFGELDFEGEGMWCDYDAAGEAADTADVSVSNFASEIVKLTQLHDEPL
jgi:hypothetical protein